ncbi:App1 family protein [Aureimonas ureilytica]|uniref:App1 family protein n=1 Tax=Aureimonas ureilytica TaxID=401562 RepID=UPI0003709D7C|nr:phosphatase domain-containing protein [Aureimonas ureilytica]
MGFGAVALRVVGGVATLWDEARTRLKLRLGLTSPPILLPYRGYVAKGRVYVSGRVVEDEGVVGAPPSRSRWTNLKRSFRRYETDEIRGARVDWRLGTQAGTVETDREGFFAVEAPFDPGLLQGPRSHETGSQGTVSQEPWVPVELTLREAPFYEVEPATREAPVRLVSSEAAFLVVSDLDDTVIETGARHLLTHLRTVALNSAEGRVAFPGVASFLRALAAGRGGPDTNPIFYVSSSPWNLYEVFEDFMRLRAIPHGAMFLKDFGLSRTQWLTGSHRRHKLAAIDHILSAYPHLPVVLVGDTGQSDGPIYAEIVRQQGARVLAVYLRDVTPKGFQPRLRRAIEEIEAAGIPFVSGPTLEKAAAHAEAAGLVEPGAAERMAEDIRLDEDTRQKGASAARGRFKRRALRERPEEGG